MINIDTQKENVTKAAKTVVEGTVSVGTKAVDFSTTTAATAAEKAKAIFAQSKELATTGIDKVTAVKVGDKNIGERASATVDSVQSAVDVEKISGQVAKLRDQIEGALGSWKDSFRPSSDEVKVVKAPAATRTATKKPAAKATVTKAAATKPAAKKAATTKTAAKKAVPKAAPKKK
jgi:hypothetical protein